MIFGNAIVFLISCIHFKRHYSPFQCVHVTVTDYFLDHEAISKLTILWSTSNCHMPFYDGKDCFFYVISNWRNERKTLPLHHSKHPYLCQKYCTILIFKNSLCFLFSCFNLSTNISYSRLKFRNT